MARSTGEFIGLKEANRALRQLPAHAKGKVQPQMDATAFQVARGAQARVRRRTGLLAARIAWRSRPRSVGAVVGVYADAFHWKYVEYGTVHMPSSPFMRPSAEAVRSDHHQRVVRALGEAGRQVAANAAASSRLL